MALKKTVEEYAKILADSLEDLALNKNAKQNFCECGNKGKFYIYAKWWCSKCTINVI